MLSLRALFYSLLLLAALSFGAANMPAAAQYALRIGLIGSADGSMRKGALLAARHINEAGGIIAADGAEYSLSVVDTPADNMAIAIANMRQASVIAVIGPEEADLIANYMPQLQSLGLPVFTPATGDTLLLQDNSGRIFRSRARQSVSAGALADYLVNSLRVQTIQTVQIDRTSTARLIAFANALAGSGVRLSNTRVDGTATGLDNIARDIAAAGADLVAIYGPPAAAAQVYNRIRAGGYAGRIAYDFALEPGFASNVPAESLQDVLAAATWSPALEDAASEAFVLNFAREFGHLPDAIAAASYDATLAIVTALFGSGSLSENLAALRQYAGVQGLLSPADLVRGELSSNAVVLRLNEHGAPNVVARYHAGAPASLADRPAASPTPPATATPAPTPTPSGYTLTIQSAVQNVRGGPGLQYEVIGQLQRGTQARVLGATPDYSWLVIDFGGRWGWLASHLVVTVGNRSLLPVIQPPATPTPVPTSTPAPPREPDLLVLNAYPSRIILDRPTTVNVTVRNQGLTAAGSFAIAASFEPGGRYVGVNAPGLAPGGQTTLQLSQTLSGATGPQSVIIVVDLNQEVAEGAAGEANNRAYAYNYVADRPELASGSLTIGVGDFDLDGYGIPDLSWTGADLVTLGAAGMYMMDYFSSIEAVHYDAIDLSQAHITSLRGDLLTNATIGMRTADGHHAVLKPASVTPDGHLSFLYRVYR